MIYLFDNLECLSESFLYKMMEILPLERMLKAQSYKFLIDRKQSVLGYLLLLFGLRKEYGIFEELEFSYGQNGKPYLKNYQNIHFNISHCKYGVVCVISDKVVGIDIEAIDDFDIELAKHICNVEEMNVILNSSNQEIEFYKLWTKKESFLKLNGDGISSDLKSVLEETGATKIITFESDQIKVNKASSKKYIISLCTCIDDC